MKIAYAAALVCVIVLLQSCERNAATTQIVAGELDEIPSPVISFFKKSAVDFTVEPHLGDGAAIFSITGIRGENFSILEYADLVTQLETEGRWKIGHPYVTFEEVGRFFYILEELEPELPEKASVGSQDPVEGDSR